VLERTAKRAPAAGTYGKRRHGLATRVMAVL